MKISTSTAFNEKYKNWLEEGHYGLSIEDEAVINYLDNKFTELIKNNKFSYSQIKIKFGSSRFYAKGLESFELDDIEFNIDKLLKGKLDPRYA